jgi:hypothetical protein
VHPTLTELLATPPLDIATEDVYAYLDASWAALPETITLTFTDIDGTHGNLTLRRPRSRTSPLVYRLVTFGTLNPQRVSLVTAAGSYLEATTREGDLAARLRTAWDSPRYQAVRTALNHCHAALELGTTLSVIAEVSDRRVRAGEGPIVLRPVLLDLAATAPHLSAEQADLAATLVKGGWDGTPTDLLATVTTVTTPVPASPTTRPAP